MVLAEQDTKAAKARFSRTNGPLPRLRACKGLVQSGNYMEIIEYTDSVGLYDRKDRLVAPIRL